MDNTLKVVIIDGQLLSSILALVSEAVDVVEVMGDSATSSVVKGSVDLVQAFIEGNI